jgi:hypothetical protein
MEYGVVYVARSPASLRQDEFAGMVDATCNEWARGGWRLISTVGDYGARVTLGVWLVLAKEGDPGSDRPVAESHADEFGTADADDEAGSEESGDTDTGGLF